MKDLLLKTRAVEITKASRPKFNNEGTVPFVQVVMVMAMAISVAEFQLELGVVLMMMLEQLLHLYEQVLNTPTRKVSLGQIAIADLELPRKVLMFQHGLF